MHACAVSEARDCQEQRPSGPARLKFFSLIGDYVSHQGNVHHVCVRDLIVSQGGELQAVIVSPEVDFSHGRVASLRLQAVIRQVAGQRRPAIVIA